VFQRHGQPPGPLWEHILHRPLQRRCALDTTLSVPGVLQSGHAQVAVRHTVLLSFSGFVDVRWGSCRYPAGQWRIRSKSTYVSWDQSWASPVGIVIRLSDGRRANGDIIPGRRKEETFGPALGPANLSLTAVSPHSGKHRKICRYQRWPINFKSKRAC
jgi:hypothetical protein